MLTILRLAEFMALGDVQVIFMYRSEVLLGTNP